MSRQLLSLFFLILTAPLSAGFSVAPLMLEFTTEPLQTDTAVVQIRNNDDAPLRLKLYQKDFVMQRNGEESELDPGVVPRGCSAWVSLNPSGILELKPGEAREVRITMTTPQSSFGTYWSKFFVEQLSRPKPIEQKRGDTTMQIYIKQRWEVRIHNTVPNTGERLGDIVTMHAIEDTTAPEKIVVAFENQGDILLRCNGHVAVKDNEGKTLQTIPIGDDGYFAVYPGTTRELAVEPSDDLPSGHYLAVAVVDYGDDDLVAGELVFNVKSRPTTWQPSRSGLQAFSQALEGQKPLRRHSLLPYADGRRSTPLALNLNVRRENIDSLSPILFGDHGLGNILSDLKHLLEQDALSLFFEEVPSGIYDDILVDESASASHSYNVPLLALLESIQTLPNKEEVTPPLNPLGGYDD